MAMATKLCQWVCSRHLDLWRQVTSRGRARSKEHGSSQALQQFAGFQARNLAFSTNHPTCEHICLSMLTSPPPKSLLLRVWFFLGSAERTLSHED